MKKVTNTSTNVHPVMIADMGFHGGSGDRIVASEKAGQRELVESDVLPSSMSPEDRSALESFGVVFGEIVPGDPLFIVATLPKGWGKEASSNHQMWSALLDDQGRKRANIFYKAAFYDRRANLSVCRRYIVNYHYPESSADRSMRCTVEDSGKVLYDTGFIGENDSMEARDLAFAWADKNFPEWKSPAAYWHE